MSQLTGWLLYTKEDYMRNQIFAQRFIDLGNNSISSINLVFKDDIYYGIKNNSLCLMDLKGNIITPPDFVINRTIDSLISRHFEGLNIKVFNSGYISEICNDKSRTYLEVSSLDVPMVDTLFVDKTLLSGHTQFDYPVVIKTVGGRGGKEVFLAHSSKELLRFAHSTLQERFVVQKLSGNAGKDVRVFIVRKDIIGSVLRISNGGFKANLSLGGRAEPYILNPKEKELVMRIVNHFDFDMVGIDFIFDEKGRFLFNEIEDVAGSRTLSMTSSVDIVKLYLKHIYNVLRG